MWLLLAAAACPSAPAPTDPLAAQGRAVYQARCATCHNVDPAKPGAVGPAVQGASRALIEARVLRAAYPPGHTPKRDTHVMVAMPELAGEVDALTAWLAAP